LTGFSAKWFRRFCVGGLLASLLMWMMPAQLRWYQFYRRNFDWKVQINHINAEFGMAPSGLVVARVVEMFKVTPEMGHTGKQLDPIRRQWMESGSKSTKPWPVNSRRLTWDEWGPSRWISDDGLIRSEEGRVYCLPYSIMAMGCAGLLLAQWLLWMGVRETPKGKEQADAAAAGKDIGDRTVIER
jgi:hypothetical protein